MPTDSISTDKELGSLPVPFTSVSTGFTELDDSLGGGLMPGLTVICSTFVDVQAELLRILAHNAASGRHVLFFSAGERQENIFLRLISYRISHNADGTPIPGAPGISAGRLAVPKMKFSEHEREYKTAAETAIEQLRPNIHTDERIDILPVKAVGEFLAENEPAHREVPPIVFINDLTRLKLKNTLKKNIIDLSVCANKHNICIIATYPIEADTHAALTSELLGNAAPDLRYADTILGIESEAASWISEHKPGKDRVRRFNIVAVKRPFGGMGAAAPFEYDPDSSSMVPRKPRKAPRSKMRLCYYNNTNLSTNIVFGATELSSGSLFKESDKRGQNMYYSLYADTAADDGSVSDDAAQKSSPVKFREKKYRKNSSNVSADYGPGGKRLFSYMDLVVADAIYSSRMYRKNSSRITLADIMKILTGDNTNLTPRRMEILWRSITRLALTRITIGSRKKDDDPQDSGTIKEIVSRPLLPLAENERIRLKECYNAYLASADTEVDFLPFLTGKRNCAPIDDIKRITPEKNQKMPLFEYAEEMHQILTYPLGLMKIPRTNESENINDSEHCIMIKHFLVKRLELIRYNYSASPKKLKDLNHIMFEDYTNKGSGLYTRIGWSKQDPYSWKDINTRQRERDRAEATYSKVRSILTYYQRIGYIGGFSPYYGKKHHSANDGADSDRPDLNRLSGVTIEPFDPHNIPPKYVCEQEDINWDEEE